MTTHTGSRPRALSWPGRQLEDDGARRTYSTSPAAGRRRPGVGLRPHVHRIATELGLSGFVGNDGQGAFVEVEGDPLVVESFLDRLAADPPPLAAIERIETESLSTRGDDGFTIVTSDHAGGRDTLVSPDVATCADCVREMTDPADRRYGYPFTNCTNCGPRYTIVRDVPYDRASTTMAGFPLCSDCAREYHDPADRRFHAQPVCCPACGPALLLVDMEGAEIPGDPIAVTSRLLRDGEIIAIKGLGGYHLAVNAADEGATARLRARKHREEKPFAVMAVDIEMAGQLGEVGDAEAALLRSPAAPILLLRRRPDAAVAAAVAPSNRWLGVMLPYSPLHHLLLGHHGETIVLTSGNVSDEPIAYHDDDARDRLSGIADAMLLHDRPIHMRVDDSVVRVTAGRPMPVRRSRGYAPRPITVPWRFPRHVLGVGAELKSTVCLARDNRAFVSPPHR
jgi:hydrogenase maturation protein HypF